jgi:hypothetical protein
MEGVWCIYDNDFSDYAHRIFQTFEEGAAWLTLNHGYLMFWAFTDDFFEAVFKHELKYGAYRSATKE